MDNPQHHLRRGFNWLGGATVIAKAIDFGTILLVLLFLTKEQVGVASLVLSVGMVVEAFEGAGIGDALVQTQAVSRQQLHSVFWLVVGLALVIAGVLLAAAPLLQAIYGVAGMATYFIAVAVKQPLVGAALVPLAMMNRALKYERLAIIDVCATLAAALTRLGLAAAGTGTWALVIGFSVHGFYMLIGAQLAYPFRPRMHFSFREISGLLRFGVRASATNVFQQLFKNLDLLLIGWFYGPPPLAVYRVARDIATEPAVAVGTLVSRTALPVFARVWAIKTHLAQSLTWSLRRLLVLIAPLMAALVLIADPLTRLIHDSQGQTYANAALPLKLMAGAVLLRVTAQILYPLMLGTGRPGIAVRQSAITLLLLGCGILAVGFSFTAERGIVAVSMIWLVIYPLVLIWGARDLRRHFDIHAVTLGRALVVPAMGVSALIAAAALTRWLIGPTGPVTQIGIVGAAAALTYIGTYLYTRRRNTVST